MTNFSDYTLRVLIYLALNPDRLVTTRTIADGYSISEHHLTKVVHHLVKTGVIQSQRGNGGGIRLARAAEKIRIGEVVRAAEQNRTVVECCNDGSCCISDCCSVSAILTEAYELLYSHLDQYTLADLTVKSQSLMKQLNIRPPFRAFEKIST
ncbi:MAG TPA: Rrf2 family transcriptional regulator [Rhodocyclaceae bacterium]|nr:Rrf2 family transcriptional regulator [Rhodocyclaceae bacterium]